MKAQRSRGKGRALGKICACFLLAESVLGCAQGVPGEGKYAVLYVASDPEGAEVISTNDGQALGSDTGTPIRVVFDRQSYPYGGDPIGLLIFKACYRPVFQRVTIDRWYSKIYDADVNANNVRPRLVPYANCSS